MIAILSPAKTLDLEPAKLKDFTLPAFLSESKTLVDLLKKKNKKGLQKLMGISEKLAQLNVDRYNDFDPNFSLTNSKQSILAFKGDVYLGLEAFNFSKAELNFAQKSIRILSGLYGVLKPFDLIQAYRLEMGTSLKTKKGKNLYEFWDHQLTISLQAELDESKKPVLINLASKEYYKALKIKNLNARVIEIDFREYKGDDLKFISFNAKKARGLMAKYIVKERAKKPEILQGFDYENYAFNEELSDENKWLFTR